jgi:hypothetical protein
MQRCRPHLLRFGRKQGVRPQTSNTTAARAQVIARIRIPQADFPSGIDLPGRVP